MFGVVWGGECEVPGGHSEDEGTYGPRREVSEETKWAGTLIADFQPPGRSENKFLLLKPPSLWLFAMVVQEREAEGVRKCYNWL